ncbi:MAG: hypothetical protein ACLFVD_04355 [Dehalococcoidia bacterium]
MPASRRKWFIAVALLSVIVIGVIAGGVVAAADESSSPEEQAQIAGPYLVLLDRACAIYEQETGVAIDCQQLRDALGRARREMRDEALQRRVQGLVDGGVITQQEADEYLGWWESRPGIELQLPGLGERFRRGGMMWGRGPGSVVGPGGILDAPDQAGG